ncbi:transglutaminase TgpA family protein [Thalassoroseus pseudoceratinae]|uniref:transglutaminase TgpA family protein n=1 Tax=Thalassoroseus pseudoceratinae TaxID=2713176 RepID=UPI0014202A3E|nr:DUF3488 and transglutaminase-like domain-containing protein [Thalassoroseus pseudoceratinae]
MLKSGMAGWSAQRLLTVLQYSVYGHVAFSAVMLLVAEGTKTSLPPQTLTVPIALAAFFLVERWERFDLPTWIGNAGGTIAVLVSTWALVTGDNEARLLSLAHFLVYLTWIVLLQRKTQRHFWSLCALSVGQAAVGAVLTEAPIYGVMLVCFMFASVWTLTVFSLYTSHQEFDFADRVSTVPTEKAKPLNSTPTAELLHELHRPSTVTGSVQRDPSRNWITTRFTLGNLGMGAASLMMAFVLFLIVPRNQEIWGSGKKVNSNDQLTTGFAREIQLGDLGDILESNKRVMEIRLFENGTDRELDIERYAQTIGYDEPYFRGSVLDEYQRGRWKNRTRGRSFQPSVLRNPLLPEPGSIRQEILLEPVDKEILFGIAPIIGGKLDNMDDSISRDDRTMMLRLPESQRNPKSQIQYTLLSPRPVPSKEPRLHGNEFSERRHEQTSKLNKWYVQVPTELTRLQELAREKSGYQPDNGNQTSNNDTNGQNEPAAENPSPRERADRILHYLRDSGEFGYTLNARISDPRDDPIEDFLFARKVGHCEYFGSALALMLRAVHIPARLVSGFKGVEVDEYSGHALVQERHAHVWVEAFIDGEWRLYDPTPSNLRSASVNEIGGETSGWSRFQAGMKNFWSRYIVNLNEIQQRSLLSPVKETALWLGIQIRSLWTNAGNHLRRIRDIVMSPRRWFSWEGGAISFFLLLGLVGVVALGRWIGRTLLKQFRDRRLASRHAERQIAFYERFRRLSAKAGFKRHPSQTQREFARFVQSRYESVDWKSIPGPLFDPVADAFYRVRFGHEELNIDELNNLERFLDQWETQIAAGKPTS